MALVLFEDRLAIWGKIDDADLLRVHLFTVDIPLERPHARLVIHYGATRMQAGRTTSWRDMASFSELMMVLWMRNLSLHLALMGRFSFMA